MGHAANKAEAESGIKLIAKNRKAHFDFAVEEKLEAGLALLGSEVKGMRQATVNLADAYAMFKGDELFLYNAHIGTNQRGNIFSHEPTRSRKLLMHRQEIDRWITKVREKGYSIVPLMLYFKKGRAKVELALCRGKTHQDRRADLKKKDAQREMQRAMRGRE